jgi:hypothetical protein
MGSIILTEEDVDALRVTLDSATDPPSGADLEDTVLDVTAGEVERAWFDGFRLGRSGSLLGVIPPGVVGEHYEDGWAAGVEELQRQVTMTEADAVTVCECGERDEIPF